MALNEVYKEAESLRYAVNSAVRSGMFVVLGGTAGSVSGTGIVGVAETDAVLGEDGLYYATLRHIGAFTGTTAAATTPGTALYLASAATYGTALVTTATSNFHVGHAIAAKGATAGNVTVRINN
jgi:predicted RecA/RadA family phage recombinase